MRALSVVRKTLVEQLRDPWSLVLAVSTAPFFVVLYFLITGGGSTTYPVMVLDHDRPVALADGSELAAGRAVVAAMGDVKYSNGQPMLRVSEPADRAAADAALRDRDASALVIVPEDFSARLLGRGAGDARAGVTFVGDLSNASYSIAMMMGLLAVDGVVSQAVGAEAPYRVDEEALGSSGARTEFENYVPGLLVISIVLLLFTAAMAVAREVEAGTLSRLKLTRMSAFDFLFGVSAVQFAIGVLGMLATFGVAVALGFRSQGPIAAAIVVGCMTALGVIGVGLVVACFARTVTRAFLAANLPFMLLMFLSGAVFPLPKPVLFRTGAHAVGLFDFLPPTHAVVAFNKILSLGASFGDVAWELGWLTALSALYFAVGVWLFHRTHLRAT
ncbi:MAG: ABC transporter permease [Polyangiaceae bacterium]|nr:ABC transporter permease [Polyangiaceae bacterium]